MVDPACQPHHPDIQAALTALERFAPETAGRASAAWRVLLRQAYGHTGPMGWSFSRLTGDGFPLEITFTTADKHLRYTADPGGPGVPVAAQLDYAAGLMVELGSAPPEAPWLDYLRAAQASGKGELQYGAWVGGRHSASQGGAGPPGADRFKLYAEVPDGPLESWLNWLSTYLDLPPRFLYQPIQFRMAAVEPATGRLEFYFRISPLEAGRLPLLLLPAGLARRAGELADFIEAAYGYALKERIPGGSVGFSYSLVPNRGGTVFTLFLFTRMLWGGDARIRRRFRERLEAAGQEPGGYWQLTAPLANRDLYQTYHGLLGLVLVQEAPIQLSLGVRTPPVAGSRLDITWSAQP